MFSLFIYLLKHAPLRRHRSKLKEKPALKHLTNVDAFDIEDSTTSFKLRCAKRVLAFFSVSLHIFRKSAESSVRRNFLEKFVELT